MSLPLNTLFNATAGTLLVGYPTDTGGQTWLNAGGTNTAVMDGTVLSGGASGGVSMLQGNQHDVAIEIVTQRNGDSFNILFASDAGATQFLKVLLETNSPGFVRLFDQDNTPYSAAFTPNIPPASTTRIEVVGSTVNLLVNGVSVFSVTAAVHLAQTYVGLDTPPTDGHTISFNVAAFSPSNPTAACVPAAGGNTFQGTAGTEGTGPWTNNWQRSTAPNSGFADLANGSGVSGATTLTLLDQSAAALAALTSQTALAYRNRVRDSLGADFFSNMILAIPGTHQFDEGWLWDSIGQGSGTEGPGPAYLAAAPAIYGARVVGLTNLSDGGQSTSHWYDSQGSGVQTQLVTDIAAMRAAGRTLLSIRLGINDAAGGRIASVYNANLAGMAAYALSQGFTKVILHYPTGITNAPIMALMQTYLAGIDAQDNGGNIRVGDKQSFTLFSMLSQSLLQTDGTHQNDAGLIPLACLTALATARVFDDVPTGGSGVNGSRKFSGF